MNPEANTDEDIDETEDYDEDDDISSCRASSATKDKSNMMEIRDKIESVNLCINPDAMDIDNGYIDYQVQQRISPRKQAKKKSIARLRTQSQPPASPDKFKQRKDGRNRKNSRFRASKDRHKRGSYLPVSSPKIRNKRRISKEQKINQGKKSITSRSTALNENSNSLETITESPTDGLSNNGAKRNKKLRRPKRSKSKANTCSPSKKALNKIDSEKENKKRSKSKSTTTKLKQKPMRKTQKMEQRGNEDYDSAEDVDLNPTSSHVKRGSIAHKSRARPATSPMMVETNDNDDIVLRSRSKPHITTASNNNKRMEEISRSKSTKAKTNTTRGRGREIDTTESDDSYNQNASGATSKSGGGSKRRSRKRKSEQLDNDDDIKDDFEFFERLREGKRARTKSVKSKRKQQKEDEEESEDNEISQEMRLKGHIWSFYQDYNVKDSIHKGRIQSALKNSMLEMVKFEKDNPYKQINWNEARSFMLLSIGQELNYKVYQRIDYKHPSRYIKADRLRTGIPSWEASWSGGKWHNPLKKKPYTDMWKWLESYNQKYCLLRCLHCLQWIGTRGKFEERMIKCNYPWCKYPSNKK